ncbi:hypothetical protein T10_5823 [Trichinella papuae]|uniref:HAT C-terminal dimerisation domain-containing protein n=1 Tax=Trichinella papuae TaxID=268474 RepID=A0A0V1M4V2_9BILA|nr:hypothetical protein T10_5823 [Trichinella papuae]
MNRNCKGMKSLMDFYPKSESNAETGRNVPTDLDCRQKKAGLSFCISGCYSWKCALDKSKGCQEMSRAHVDTFPNTYKMAATALMISVSVSTCEASFSAYSRILTPFQRSMSNSRMRNLVLW